VNFNEPDRKSQGKGEKINILLLNHCFFVARG